MPLKSIQAHASPMCHTNKSQNKVCGRQSPEARWANPNLSQGFRGWCIFFILFKAQKRKTFKLNSSAESQEPIFSNAVKAGAAADPNSSEEASRGSSCYCWEKKNVLIITL